MVLGGVDERVDTAARQNQHDGEVVEPSREVDRVGYRIHEEEYPVAWYLNDALSSPAVLCLYRILLINELIN